MNTPDTNHLEDMKTYYRNLWNLSDVETNTILTVAKLLGKTPEEYHAEVEKNKAVVAGSKNKPVKPEAKTAPTNATNAAYYVFMTYKNLGQPTHSNDAHRYIQDHFKKQLTAGNFIGRQSQLVSIGALEIVAENKYQLTEASKNLDWNTIYQTWHKYVQEQEVNSSINKAPKSLLFHILNDDNSLTIAQRDEAIDGLAKALKEAVRTPNKTVVYNQILTLINKLK